jgi:type VI secretion system protein ImpA
MSSTPVLNIDRLLAPIADEQACGEPLRWDPAWAELSKLRKRQTDILGATQEVPPDWPQIIAVATELLSTRTKDLLIAGWLTEALVRQYGFAGLRDGLRFIRGLVERFWDGLYPEIEDGDLEPRAAPFVWLTDKDGGARMPAILSEIPLARSENEDVYSWTYWNARLVAGQRENEDADTYEHRKNLADTKRERFDAAVAATPAEFYVERLDEITACLREIDELAVLVDDHLADYAPGWSAIRKTLGDLEIFLHSVLRDKGVTSTAGGQAAAVDGNGHSEIAGMIAMPASAAAAAVAGGAIRTRAEAIARLEEAARFFSAADPHSPVAFLVRRAIRWANMSFEDLLSELIRDEPSLSHVSETLGLNRREQREE